MTTRNDSEFRSAVLEAVERCQAQLIRYTSRFFAGDQEAARDVVQHAFLQLCRTEPGKRPEKLNQWLYRVCRNRAIDIQRDRKRLHTGDQQQVSMQEDASLSSFEVLSASELNELIRIRLAKLPETQGEAIDLWSIGFRYSEIATVMDRPESSIRVLVHRGLSRLRSDPDIRRWLCDEDSTDEHPHPLVSVPVHTSSSVNSSGELAKSECGNQGSG